MMARDYADNLIRNTSQAKWRLDWYQFGLPSAPFTPRSFRYFSQANAIEANDTC